MLSKLRHLWLLVANRLSNNSSSSEVRNINKMERYQVHLLLLYAVPSSQVMCSLNFLSFRNLGISFPHYKCLLQIQLTQYHTLVPLVMNNLKSAVLINARTRLREADSCVPILCLSIATKQEVSNPLALHCDQTGSFRAHAPLLSKFRSKINLSMCTLSQRVLNGSPDTV